MSEFSERELGWEDAIERDGGDFILLQPGDYDFTVESLERGRHDGSAKLPPCNKATLKIKISTPEGDAVINHSLFLHTKCEGILCAFFTAIGQRQHGQRITMNWTAVPGSCGRCKVGLREWVNQQGETKQSNEIKKFYEPTADSKVGTQWKAGTF